MARISSRGDLVRVRIVSEKDLEDLKKSVRKEIMRRQDTMTSGEVDT
ncbi:MAG: hypothetical protein MASP_01769 [Candidatus Methanolliviera sp. GoM_asphalt]|nr:MAG: hypothetical protein MASP_01769 [Candidatus Methanolliviera sp. GoM_asphalt]